MELEGIHPRLLRELMEVHTETFSNIVQQPWLTDLEIPADYKIANVMPVLKKGWKEDLSIRPCQSDLCAREGYRADPLECHHTARTGQQGHQGKSAQVCERQVLLI